MPPPITKAKPAMSFEELMSGVGAGHRMVAAQPGATRYANRAVQIGTPELQLLEDRFKQGWFRTPAGVDLKPEVQIISRPTINAASEKAKLAVGRLPEYSRIAFLDPSGKDVGSVAIKSVDPKIIAADRDAAAMEQYMQMAAKSKISPRIFNFDASLMPESIGRPVYQTLFDMMRAGGYMNYVDALSPVNQMRRPGNVMSYGLAHGDYENIPLFSSSSGKNPYEASYSDRARMDAEEEALRRMVMKRTGYDTAMSGNVRDFNAYSPDAKTGLLALKELQMAKAHGSPHAADLGAELGHQYVFPQANPMDMGQLAQYARRAREEGTGSLPDLERRYSSRSNRSPDEWGPHRGMSPHLFGKVGTTEALLSGIQSGLKPEDVIEELLGYPGAMQAIKGRYAKGGLVAALQC